MVDTRCRTGWYGAVVSERKHNLHLLAQWHCRGRIAAVATHLVQMEQLAGQVQAALQTADLTGYWELLDPDVTWGAPDDMTPSCRNRDQVLAWYRSGRAKGARATITETVVRNEKILVGLSVFDGQSSSDSNDVANRRQILTVKKGLVIDIRGFEEREDAISRMG
jgi:hypothetical protein